MFWENILSSTKGIHLKLVRPKRQTLDDLYSNFLHKSICLKIYRKPKKHLSEKIRTPNIDSKHFKPLHRHLNIDSVRQRNSIKQKTFAIDCLHYKPISHSRSIDRIASWPFQGTINSSILQAVHTLLQIHGAMYWVDEHGGSWSMRAALSPFDLWYLNVMSSVLWFWLFYRVVSILVPIIVYYLCFCRAFS